MRKTYVAHTGRQIFHVKIRDIKLQPPSRLTCR